MLRLRKRKGKGREGRGDMPSLSGIQPPGDPVNVCVCMDVCFGLWGDLCLYVSMDEVEVWKVV